MVHAALSDRLFLYFSPFFEDGFIAAKKDVGGYAIVQALVESLVVIVFDKATYMAFQITG
jgi:hypothetical protein